MANTQRRKDYIDRNGNMFIPINVEGGTYEEHFFNTAKLLTMIGMIAALAFLIYLINSNGLNFTSGAFLIIIWFLVCSVITRFVVFEEKFYYHMYQELKEHEITSPAIFWDIASIKDTDEGAILTYSDAKIAVIVKVERDTITGKNKDFKEVHYDAISDFYREVVTNRYGFIQMNIMEPAGKDPRLNELSKIVYKSDNENIRKLMEMEVGHIKNITHKSLYESDYFLFYTQDLSKVDHIITDVTECIFKLLDGAFISFSVLSSKEIVELVKELYGVNYFNYTQASLQMFNRNATMMANPFNIKGILWDTGEDQELNNMEISKLRNITTSIIRETMKSTDVSLKETLYRKEEKKKVGIDFSTLSQSSFTNNNVGRNMNGMNSNMQSNRPQVNQQNNRNKRSNTVKLNKQPQNNGNNNINIQNNNMMNTNMYNNMQNNTGNMNNQTQNVNHSIIDDEEIIDI